MCAIDEFFNVDGFLNSKTEEFKRFVETYERRKNEIKHKRKKFFNLEKKFNKMKQPCYNRTVANVLL